MQNQPSISNIILLVLAGAKSRVFITVLISIWATIKNSVARTSCILMKPQKKNIYLTLLKPQRVPTEIV
jgi:hypothetical protein